MRNKVLLVAAFVFAQEIHSFAQTGLEQYYWKDKNTSTFMPVVHFQNTKNWYAEARFNYEEINTYSLNVGRTFEQENKFGSYSLTPFVGAVAGELKGGSLGFLTTGEYRDWFFSSQSQCTLSNQTSDANFLYCWAELGYTVRWFYFGSSVQLTRFTHHGDTVADPGAFIGFESGNWTFPIYGFNLQNAGRYFLVGFNFTIERKKTGDL
jgi:hypothetical protein